MAPKDEWLDKKELAACKGFDTNLFFDKYEEDEETIEHNKPFLETKIENVIVKPKYLGFKKILITTFDESFEQVEKEYNENDIIEL